MRKILPAALASATFALLMLVAPTLAPAQAGDQDAAKNAAQARAALDAMVQALGGQLWLNINNMERHGHLAAFYQGNPDPGTTEFFEFHEWPDHDRTEYTSHRDVVQFYVGRQAWEVTYRGKKPLDKDIAEDYLRRRDHSIETAVKLWMKDPNTILLYEGQHMVERHLGEQVTLISPQNESITILMDVQTHLPLCSLLPVARPRLPRQEHRHRRVRRLPHHSGLPYSVHGHAPQERRPCPAILR